MGIYTVDREEINNPTIKPLHYEKQFPGKYAFRDK